MAQQYPLSGKDDPAGVGQAETAGDVTGTEDEEADVSGKESEGSGTLEQQIEEVKQKARELKPEDPG